MAPTIQTFLFLGYLVEVKTIQTLSLAFLSLIILASVGVTSLSTAANLSDDHFLLVVAGKSQTALMSYFIFLD